MVSIAGSKKLKRQMAPQFWGITRKAKRFVITVKPGSHKKSHSIPSQEIRYHCKTRITQEESLYTNCSIS
jgi:ribosomal protein S4E